MEATIVLDYKGFGTSRAKVGMIETEQVKHTLYYDAGVGLYFRVDNKVKTIATKVDVDDFDKIRDEIIDLIGTPKESIKFNVWLNKAI